MDLLTVTAYSKFLYSLVLSPAVTSHAMAPGSAPGSCPTGRICPPPRPGRGHSPPSAAPHRAQGGYLPLGGISAPAQGISPGGKICPLGAYLPLGGDLHLGGVTCHWGRGITPPSCPHICPPEPLICPMAPICSQPHSGPGAGAIGRNLQGHRPHRAQPELPLIHCYPLRGAFTPRGTHCPGGGISPPPARRGSQTQHRSPNTRSPGDVSAPNWGFGPQAHCYLLPLSWGCGCQAALELWVTLMAAERVTPRHARGINLLFSFSQVTVHSFGGGRRELGGGGRQMVGKEAEDHAEGK